MPKSNLRVGNLVLLKSNRELVMRIDSVNGDRITCISNDGTFKTEVYNINDLEQYSGPNPDRERIIQLAGLKK